MLLKLTRDQQTAFQMMCTGANCAILASGGTGKSYLISQFIAYAKSKGKKVIVTSSTGISAANINGMTCHASIKLGLAKEDKNVLLAKAMKQYRTRKMWQSANILIIEEISMLNTEFFEKYSYVVAGLRSYESKPFGGIQVIILGDFLQLPSIGSNQYIYECETYKMLQFKNLILTQVVRQSDTQFIDLLTKVRMGEIDGDVYQMLKDRQIKHNIEGILKLYPVNKDVDTYNDQMLRAIETEEHVYHGRLSCTRCTDERIRQSNYESLLKDCVARKTLTLKVGCKVLHLRNDPSREIVNGSRGTVVDFNKLGIPIVRFGTKDYDIGYHNWDRETPDGVFTFSMIPLICAWAITVHKSQSMTIDEAELDLGVNVFERGMAYVALSRLRSLEGLYISNLSLKAFIADSKVIEYYRTLKSDIESITDK